MSSSRATPVQPIRDLRVALGFLTRIPVGDVSGGDPSRVRIASAVPWFPTIGLAIGLFQGGVWWAMSQVASPLVAAVVAVVSGLLVTGAFHHDGLADMADAFGGGWTVEQRFEILKDSRLGTYGTAALTSALMIEVAALSSMTDGDGFRALVVAHGLGRAAALAVMLTAPVAGDGLGASYMRELSTSSMVLGMALAIGVTAFVSPVLVVWPLVGVAVGAIAVVALSVRKIGGVTGDVLGAVTVCAHLACLVVIQTLL